MVYREIHFVIEFNVFHDLCIFSLIIFNVRIIITLPLHIFRLKTQTSYPILHPLSLTFLHHLPWAFPYKLLRFPKRSWLTFECPVNWAKKPPTGKWPNRKIFNLCKKKKKQKKTITWIWIWMWDYVWRRYYVYSRETRLLRAAGGGRGISISQGLR